MMGNSGSKLWLRKFKALIINIGVETALGFLQTYFSLPCKLAFGKLELKLNLVKFTHVQVLLASSDW